MMRFTNQLMKTGRATARPFQMAMRRYRTTNTTRQQFQRQKSPKFLARLASKEKYTPTFLLLVAALTPFIFANQFQRSYIEEAREKGWPQLHQHNARIAKKIKEGRVNAPDTEETERIVKNYKMGGKYAGNVPEEDHYEYILIGGGTASFAALQAIRRNDPQGKVLIVCNENCLPYERPPLTKELWMADSDQQAHTFTDYKGEQTSVFFKNNDYYKENNVTVLTSTTVTNLNINDKSIKLNSGYEIGYNKCLLATGAEPRVLAQGSDLEKVTTFRTLEDFDKVAQDIQQNKDKDIVVVGGSFLGTEIAYAIGKKLKDEKSNGSVTQVFLEREVLSRILPSYLNDLVRRALENIGVALVPNTTVGQIEYDDKQKKVRLQLSQTKWLEADYVINATGVFPNIELAEEAGLEIDSKNFGVAVNSELEARGEVYVAGDVCSYYDQKFGRRRTEHHDNAVATGKTAGYNMSCEVAGKKKKQHTYQSMFWSGMGKELHFEVVGHIAASLRTVAVFDRVAMSFTGEEWQFASKTEGRFACHPNSGTVYYIDGKNKIVGILFLNKDKPKFKAARKMIGKVIEHDEEFSKLTL